MSIVEAEIVQPLAVPGANLTLREKALVDNLLQVKVKWKAAKQAGYTGSMNTLAVTANETLKKPHVNAYYLERLRELHISADELLAEVGSVVRVPLDSKTLKKTGVRVADKLKAGEMIGRWIGLEKNETELSTGDVDRISDAVIAGLFAAAQRRRLEASTSSSNVTDSPESS